MQILFHPYRLKLKHKFTIAHDSRDFQDTLIVELTDGKISGFGEATANRYYGITIQQIIKDIKKVIPVIKQSPDNPEKLWQQIFPLLKHNSFALSAIDIASYDYAFKKKALPLYQYWKLDPFQIPVTNYTIGFDTEEMMIKKIKEVEWPVYKVKLGKGNDIDIVKALRNQTNAIFRIDANGGWSPSQTIEYSHQLQQLGVEFIEQPLKASDIKSMEKVFAESSLPLIADESCQREEDIEICKDRFHGINIKLSKCGGLTPALRMIRRIRSLGMKVMMGCMTESSVGISAIAHIAPLVDYVDMDGAMLLVEDIADGVKINKQGVVFPNENGIGANLKKSHVK